MLVLLALVGLVGASVDSPACHEFCKVFTKVGSDCSIVNQCDSKKNCTNFKQDLFGFYVDDGSLRLSWPRVVPCAQVERHLRMILPLVGLDENFLPIQQEDVSELPLHLEASDSGSKEHEPVPTLGRSGLVEEFLPVSQEDVDKTVPRYSGTSTQRDATRMELEYIDYAPGP